MSLPARFNTGDFSPLLIRVAIGFYFFLLGLWSYLEPHATQEVLKRYADLSNFSMQFYIHVAPILFFGIGVALILGIFTKISACAGALLILPLLYLAGAFSPSPDHLAYFLEKRSLYRDVIVLAGCLSLILSGSGAFGIDRALSSFYKESPLA